MMYRGEKDFQKEILDWQLNQIKMREKYSDTPAGFSEPEAAECAYKKWQQSSENHEKTRKFELLSEYHPADEFFAGREEELKEISESLKKKQGPVVIYGVGGIGKSALVREYVRKYGQMYDHVLRMHFESSIEETILDDIEFRISNFHYQEEVFGGRRKYFREKYKFLRHLAGTKKLLVIVDNFNERHDKDLEKLFSLPCDIIITSRIKPVYGSRRGCGCIGQRLGILGSEREWADFIKGYKKSEVTETELSGWRDYRQEVGGHTLLMQLALCNPDIIKCDIKREYWSELFSRFSLKKVEKKALTYLSIMPLQGMPEQLFYRITDISEHAVKRLTEYILVTRTWDENREDYMLGMHPLLAEAARDMFKPCCQNLSGLLKGLAAFLCDKDSGGTWMRTYEENYFLEPYVFALLNSMGKPDPRYAYALEELVTFLWIQYYFDEAERYSVMLFEAAEQFYGEHQITGYLACRTSAVYYNRMDFDKALLWAKKGYGILESVTPADGKYSLQFALACERLAKLYRYSGREEEALSMLEKLFTCLDKNMNDNELMVYYYALLLKAKILFQMGKAKEAGKLYEERILSGQKSNDCEAWKGFRINEFHSFYVELLVAKNEMEKAYEISGNLVKNSILYRGESFKDSLSCMEQLADICVAMNKKAEAEILLEKIEESIRTDYPYQTEWRDRVLEKIFLNC
jgi:tetratricopeptide (TPR) repeat protein